MFRCIARLWVVGFLFSGQWLFAQSLSTKYTKLEEMIPMRDGVRLFTAIYIPKDTSGLHPIIMERTPYSCEPYGPGRFPYSFGNPVFVRENYIVVFQDVRGRYLSEGVFQEMTPNVPGNDDGSKPDESSDTYDTIEWLLKHIKGNNGNVGMHGISYPGFYTTAALPDAHPALKAVSPQAPVTDEFEGDDVYHRGAFFLLDNVSFLNDFDYPLKQPVRNYPKLSGQIDSADAYTFYKELGPIKDINNRFFHHQSVIWDQYLNHATRDSFWQRRDIRPHLRNVKPAVLMVGGWFDAEDLYGTLKTYEAISTQARNDQTFLLMGPWYHGGWASYGSTRFGTYQFGSITQGRFFEMEAAFFNHYLAGKGNFDEAKATIFFTGINQWRTFPAWPAPDTKTTNLYLNNGRQLSYKTPRSKSAFVSYVSDPESPVPYLDTVSPTRIFTYMAADQRFASARRDVLSFETGILKKETTIAGPIAAKLYVSTTASDLDFVVKVIDVLPDSVQTQQLVRAEIIRSKFRNSYEKPEPIVPGKVTEINLELNDVAHTFLPGHKIMVQIQSSWFPLVDMNPQAFLNIPEADEKDFKKATVKVYCNSRYPSSITFRQLED